MLAPAVAKKARDAAQCHVRLRVARVLAADAFDGGPCEIEAQVDRVFRGKDVVAQEQTMRLRVFCFVPPDGSPTGPSWLDFTELQPGALLEAFLNPVGANGFEVAMYQIALTRAQGPEADVALWGDERGMPKPCGTWQLVRRLLGLS